MRRAGGEEVGGKREQREENSRNRNQEARIKRGECP